MSIIRTGKTFFTCGWQFICASVSYPALSEGGSESATLTVDVILAEIIIDPPESTPEHWVVGTVCWQLSFADSGLNDGQKTTSGLKSHLESKTVAV